MSTFHKGKKVLWGLGAATGVTTFYYFNQDKFRVFASWTSNYEPSPCAKWDDNWDHRAPQFIRGKKVKYSQKDENNNEDVNKYAPKAARHLILIRHGQYNLDGERDEERYLTKLGRLQAEYTGKRLAELNLPYTEIVKSTMTRAQETGSIISQFLPNVSVTHCDLLREGAPIPPEPPLGNYRPERYFFEDGARIEAAFRKYFHRADPQQTEDSYHVLVCHANVIRYLTCRALQIPGEAWLRLSLNHASITWITITPSGRVVLRGMGDSGFMPAHCLSST
ncbi:serine/threonine-protein phosphatase Pgam5, mitochondrial-like isoform X2 [Anthonomus grandis grandis]|uniref:serine/threonine-protein phosphatase Pgam5, mitochondrial-like isoform X2 n=1 Tax=Anthonomus grandis grandis TaxID=2921223 RepID=UPI002164F327|nr:serine/threonine-protein phosphatase Pgam5, mitochondrial-like isoform X2 [Anthonomus grandis grandis]